ncbi:F-box protein At3g07870 [Gossypium raimondii]|uniref:F-box protein At3g07870 n=1 Tax=Gossypium raimondii TaxID=29730 RepID=UPI00063AE6E5|nr:F-box protein At3g07870 [Gossypium raimondii]
MDRLPQEVALEILSRLPLLSLVQSKSVCRAWRTFIQDQLLVNKHFKHMVENDPSFILQIMGHCIQNELYFGDLSSDPNDENVMMIAKKLTIPALLSFHLVSSCNGLLLLSATHPSFELCIYNPFTRDYVELPKRSHHAGVLGFGFDPTTKKYKVVEISYKRTTHLYFRRRVVRFGMRPASQTAASSVEVHILTVSSNTWRNLGSFPFRLDLGDEGV